MTNKMMTLYHGTTLSRSLEIESTGFISVNASSLYRVSEELRTTAGYVYLTSNPGKAVYYGKTHAIQHDEDAFCVFRVLVREQDAEIDSDELLIQQMLNPLATSVAQMPSLKSSMAVTQSCRVRRDLRTGLEVTHKMIFPVKSDPLVSELLKRRNRLGHEAIEIISMLPWEVLHHQAVK